MLTVTKIFKFEAAHSLPDYNGACHNLHGHSYRLDVTVTGDVLTNGSCRGMIIDFSVLKCIVNEAVINRYDHCFLNDYFENPTAENMVLCFAEEIRKSLPYGITLMRLKLWETETSYAEYRA